MICLDWNLSDLKNEVKQEHCHIADISIEGDEQISDFFRGKTNEVYTFILVPLGSNEILAFDVVVLAEQLQKLKGSSVRSDAGLRVQLLVSGLRLEDILSMNITLVELIEIVVVNGGDGERFVRVFNWRFRLFNVLKNEFSELGDQSLYVFHDFILIVCAYFLDHVLLGRGITSKEI